MVSSVIPPSHTKEAFVGMQLETTRQVLSQDVINDYIQRTGDTHPWYTGESPFGKPLVPAMLTYNWPGQPNSTWYPENIYGNLHARHEFEWYQPAFAGDSLVGHRVIVDRYEKRGRVYLVPELTLVRESDGAVILKQRHHQSFLIDGESQQESNTVAVDKSREKQSARQRSNHPSEADAIESFGPISRFVDKAVCDQYSGIKPNYHNDLETAEDLGFPDIVVQGTLSLAYICELLTQRFGAGLFVGGRLDIKFVNVLWVGENISAKGSLQEVTGEGSRTRGQSTVWTEKDDGTVTIVGTASALI